MTKYIKIVDQDKRTVNRFIWPADNKWTNPIQHAHYVFGVGERADFLTALAVYYRQSLQAQTLHCHLWC